MRKRSRSVDNSPSNRHRGPIEATPPTSTRRRSITQDRQPTRVGSNIRAGSRPESSGRARGYTSQTATSANTGGARGKKKQDAHHWSSQAICSLLAKATEQLVREERDDPDGTSMGPPYGHCHFELPLSIIESNPEMHNYRLLKRNVYRAPLCREQCDPDDVPICSCTPSIGCSFACENRLVFMECARGFCKAASNDTITEHGAGQNYCANTAIQTGRFPSTEVFKTRLCGYGLRVKEPVSANTILCEYLGEVITANECKSRIQQYRKGDDFYFAALQSGLVLDAKNAGSTARFANHSCDPNCEMQKWTVIGEPRIVLVSKRPLCIDEEITYNYNYFDDGLENEMRMKRQKCCCGSVNCSGTIGGKVIERAAPEVDVWFQKAENLFSSSRRTPHAVLEDLIQQGINLLNAEQSSSSSVLPPSLQLLRRLEELNLHCHNSICAANELLQLDVSIGENFTLIEVEAVQNLIDQAPIIIRLSAIDELEDKLRRYKVAVKALAKLRRLTWPHTSVLDMTGSAISCTCSASGVDSYRLAGPSLPNVSSADSTACMASQTILPESAGLNGIDSQPIDIKSDPSMGTDKPHEGNNVQSIAMELGPSPVVWEDLTIVISALVDALPIRVHGGEMLVARVRTVLHWCNHCLEIYRRSNDDIALSLPGNKNTRRRSTSRHGDTGYGQQFRNIDRYLRLYDHTSIIHTIPPSKKMELLTEFLENALEMFLRRKSFACKNCQPEQSIQHTGKRKTESNDSMPALHCFCQQPEDEAEINILVSCDVCELWYHPQCVNESSRLLNGSSFRSHSTKSDLQQANERENKTPNNVRQITTKSQFVCPLCQHLRGQATSYASAPTESAEWNIRSEFSMIAGAVVPHTLESTPTSSQNKGRRKSSSSAQKLFPFSPPDCVSLPELQELISEEGLLPATANPAALLLRLVVEQVIEWQQQVQEFFSSCSVQKILAEEVPSRITRLLKTASSVTEIADCDLAQEIRDEDQYLTIVCSETLVLRHCLRLYLELRVLKVVTTDVLRLRQLAWQLSAGSVFRKLLLGNNPRGSAEGLPINAGLLPSNEFQWDSMPQLPVSAPSCASSAKLLPTLRWKQLPKLLAAGTRLNCIGSTTFQAIEALYLSICNLAKSALTGRSLEEISVVYHQLVTFSTLIDLNDEFPFVRVRNYMLHFMKSGSPSSSTIGEQVGNDRATCFASDESILLEGDGNGVYCLCRGQDDGSTMIQCDNCSEWFHWKCLGITAAAFQRYSSDWLARKQTSTHLNPSLTDADSPLPLESFMQAHSDGPRSNDLIGSSVLDNSLTISTMPTQQQDHFGENNEGSVPFLCIACSESMPDGDLSLSKGYHFAWPCGLITTSASSNPKSRPKK